MFHQFFPLIPLTLAGALFLKRKSLAYGFPVLLLLVKVLLTQFSVITFFTGAGLIFSVFLVRQIKNNWGISVWAVAGYASISVLIYELMSNLGVWIIGGCVPHNPPTYAHTFAGLFQCYGASIPYALRHFFRDVPISVFLIVTISFLSRFDLNLGKLKRV